MTKIQKIAMVGALVGSVAATSLVKTGKRSMESTPQMIESYAVASFLTNRCPQFFIGDKNAPTNKYEYMDAMMNRARSCLEGLAAKDDTTLVDGNMTMLVWTDEGSGWIKAFTNEAERASITNHLLSVQGVEVHMMEATPEGCISSMARLAYLPEDFWEGKTEPISYYSTTNYYSCWIYSAR